MFVNLLLALLVLNIAVRMYFHVKKSKTREFKVFFLNLINFQKNKVAIITTDLATNQNVLIENVFYAKQPNQQSVDQEQSKGLCFWKPWFAKMQVKEQQARERSYENIKANRNNQNQFFNHNFFLGISR